MLAVFSVPLDTDLLNLHAERQQLRALVHKLRQTGRQVDLRILQYGATRKRLQAILREKKGWDVIHFAGHGEPNSVVLEGKSGFHDVIDSSSLLKLLSRSKRLKLITFSTCHSARFLIDRSLQKLDLDESMRKSTEDSQKVGAAPDSRSRSSRGVPLARVLTRELGCSVVAMRYAVDDEFAALFTGFLYESLLREEQRLSWAVAWAAWQTVTRRPDFINAYLSAPALFVAGGSDLQLLLIPKQEGTHPDLRVTDKPEVAHFVGRVDVMRTASQALASRSTNCGVIFYGLPGTGKTSCALEIAGDQQAVGRFKEVIWYSTSQCADHIAPLEEFIRSLSAHLGGTRSLSEVISSNDDRETVADIKQFIESNAKKPLLVIIDGAENLLNSDRSWNDSRWVPLLTALAESAQRVRVILTSRRMPRTLPSSLAKVAVNPLTLEESTLFVLSLTHLSTLLHSPVKGLTKPRRFALVRRVIQMFHGHPMLLEAADRLAESPSQLETVLNQLDDSGASHNDKKLVTVEDRRHELASMLGRLQDWTAETIGMLPSESRALFVFICALEETDRDVWVIDTNWKLIWPHLGFAGHAPAPETLSLPLVDSGLTYFDIVETEESPEVTIVRLNMIVNRVVAEVARTLVSARLRRTIDGFLSMFWIAIVVKYQDLIGETQVAPAMTLHAASASLPYLERREEWDAISRAINTILNIGINGPRLRAILDLAARAAANSEDEAANTRTALFHALLHNGHYLEAAEEGRTLIEDLIRVENYRDAEKITFDLLAMLQKIGRTDNARQLHPKLIELESLASVGPLTRISNELLRLEFILLETPSANIISDIEALLKLVEGVGDSSYDSDDEPDASVRLYKVREWALQLAWNASAEQGEWLKAVTYSDQLLAALRARGASRFECAKTALNNYAPLLELGQYDEAKVLFEDCRVIAEEAEDFGLLALAFAAKARLHEMLEHFDAAVGFEEASLRYSYIGSDATGILASHSNLGMLLTRIGKQRDGAAHLMAASMLSLLVADSPRVVLGRSRYLLELRAVHKSARISRYDDVCQIVQARGGVQFDALVEHLLPRTTSKNKLFRTALLDMLLRIPMDDLKRHMVLWLSKKTR